MRRHFTSARLVGVAVSTGVLAGCLAITSCNREKKAEAKPNTGPLTVEVAPVSTRKVQRSVESVGTLYPYDETVISAELEGRVVEVSADLGDNVRKGQPLIRIAEEEQKYLVQQNEAQLRATLERLGLTEEKARVKDIKETPDVRRAQADLTDAEQRHQRTRRLADQGIGSQQDLDQAQARLKAAQAEYDQSVNTVRNLMQEAERSRATLDLQRKKLRDTVVYAPFDGAVKDRQVATGTYVRPNSPLFTLVKIDPIRLRIEVPERMAPWVKTGQIADVTMEAFGDQRFQGKIWRISPTVDQNKRTFVVEALIPNPNRSMKPGSYARARIPTNKIDEIKVIPTQAVNYVLGANRAYVIKGGNTIDAREVKLGDRFEKEVEITEGVAEGETVAVSQINRLDSGTKVRPVPSADRIEKGRASGE